MAKLNKVNKNNSLSIILPKAITENFWKAGDEVSIKNIGHDAILIDRQEQEQWDLNQIYSNLEKGIKSQKKIINMISEVTEVNPDFKVSEALTRAQLRQFLLEVIRRI